MLMMAGIRIYPSEKLDALVKHLKLVDSSQLHVWSDNSITVGSCQWTEYYVTKGTRKYDDCVGTSDGYNIYKRSLNGAKPQR